MDGFNKTEIEIIKYPYSLVNYNTYRWIELLTSGLNLTITIYYTY